MYVMGEKMVLRLVLSGHGYRIGKKSGMIVVYKADGEKKEISVGNLSTIIVNAKGVSLSGEAISLLLKHGIQVIFLSKDRPVGKLQPMMLRSPVALKKEQVKAQMDQKGINIAKIIVLNKIINQVKLLKRLCKSRLSLSSGILSELANRIRDTMEIYSEIASAEIGSLTRSWLVSKEAEASRYYWECISMILPGEIGFRGRKARYDNPEDPFNISLNYMYSLLASQIWFAVELSGLDPFIGYLHEDNNRRPSLVMDLMEEFRQPVVDKLLITYFTKHKAENVIDENKRLSDEFRKLLLRIFFEELDRQVTFMNRTISIKGHMHLQPKRLAKYLLALTPSYTPYNVI
jgi:CRISPR-associated protein Cas1